MKQITLYEYYAHNCPADSFDLINKDGRYGRPQNPQELEAQIKDYVKRNGEKAVTELAKIHPDTALVKSVCECSKHKHGQKEEKKENFSNANGNSNIPDSQAEQINLAKMMIFGGVILVGIALIMKK